MLPPRWRRDRAVAARREVGLPIHDLDYDEAQCERFSARLSECLDALRELLARPGFGRGAPSLGAELEVFLVDDRGSPRSIAPALLDALDPERFTLELDRFDLEYNSPPFPMAGQPFGALQRTLDEALLLLRTRAADRESRVVTIGILPTLERHHLGADAMNDEPRYEALSRGLHRLRQRPFHIHIDGDEPLLLDWAHVALEGANASFQVHLRVDPSEFAALYNAAQLATAPVLAAASNSASFLGHRLWHETRIALFKQAADDRSGREPDPKRPRVCFGHQWVRRSACEVFEDIVQGHAPLLPVTSDEDPRAVVRAGGIPSLHELRLHTSTVWRWNRPVYDPSGHLRIELRALPAGPTVADMVANAAFLLGLTRALATRRVAERVPFAAVKRNFYRAAQAGIEAELDWPGPDGLERWCARKLLPSLSGLAEEGLAELGVDSKEAAAQVGVVVERARRGRTGATWQRARLGQEQLARRRSAVAEMTAAYLRRSEGGAPVHTWDP